VAATCSRQTSPKVSGSVLKKLLPGSMLTWFALTLCVGVGMSWVAISLFHVISRDQAVAALEDLRAAERIASAAHLLDNTSPVLRPALAQAISGSSLAVNASSASVTDRAVPPDRRTSRLLEVLSARLGSVQARELRVDYAKPIVQPAKQHFWLPTFWSPERSEGTNRLLSLQEEGPAFVVSMQLMDGSWLNFAFASVETLPLSTWPLMIGLIAAILIVLTLGVMAARLLTRPLARLATAAEALGRGGAPPDVPEAGLVEVRRAARAFNEMRRAIKRMIEDRTLMVAAISHDLRTPITRLRLRAEFIDDTEQQNKMLADLDQMEAIINSTLGFTREEGNPEPISEIKLSSLLGDVVAAHPPASFEKPTSQEFIIHGRIVALRRCFDNLITNALRYGRSARVKLGAGERQFVVTVEDDGPGIPPERIDDVFRPFVRLEPSRNRDSGGAGLGLTIARTVILSHGGTIRLENRKEGGLRVTVELPKG